jgi:hypothetical protein
VFPVGGVGVMLLAIAASGVVALVVLLVLRPRTGPRTAVVCALLLWSLLAVAALTLLPAAGPPGVVPADGRSPTCSFDLGGPAPDGFWILSGGQRLLNVLVFVPAGALAVLLLARWPRRAWLTAPLALVLLALYSVGIELTQLELARLDRACDVTDVVDNATGAVLGGLLGALLAPLVRPWTERDAHGSRRPHGSR